MFRHLNDEESICSAIGNPSSITRTCAFRVNWGLAFQKSSKVVSSRWWIVGCIEPGMQVCLGHVQLSLPFGNTLQKTSQTLISISSFAATLRRDKIPTLRCISENVMGTAMFACRPRKGWSWRNSTARKKWEIKTSRKFWIRRRTWT